MWPFGTSRRPPSNLDTEPPSFRDRLEDVEDRVRAAQRSVDALEGDLETWKTTVRSIRGQMTGGVRKSNGDNDLDINEAIRTGTYNGV